MGLINPKVTTVAKTLPVVVPPKVVSKPAVVKQEQITVTTITPMTTGPVTETVVIPVKRIEAPVAPVKSENVAVIGTFIKTAGRVLGGAVKGAASAFLGLTPKAPAITANVPVTSPPLSVGSFDTFQKQGTAPPGQLQDAANNFNANKFGDLLGGKDSKVIMWVAIGLGVLLFGVLLIFGLKKK